MKRICVAALLLTIGLTASSQAFGFGGWGDDQFMPGPRVTNVALGSYGMYGGGGYAYGWNGCGCGYAAPPAAYYAPFTGFGSDCYADAWDGYASCAHCGHRGWHHACYRPSCGCASDCGMDDFCGCCPRPYRHHHCHRSLCDRCVSAFDGCCGDAQPCCGGQGGGAVNYGYGEGEEVSQPSPNDTTPAAPQVAPQRPAPEAPAGETTPDVPASGIDETESAN